MISKQIMENLYLHLDYCSHRLHYYYNVLAVVRSSIFPEFVDPHNLQGISN